MAAFYDVPAVVQQAEMTEQQLVDRARAAVENIGFTVGQCAAEWTQKYANGRTDRDFGELVGLSGDQVRQRRAVFERFGVSDTYPNLRWSHFYAALTWDDALECLEWAEEMQATVAEMKAWRRAQRGEDLTQDAGTPDTFDDSEPANEPASKNPRGDDEPERVAERAPQRAKRNAGQTTSGGGKGDSEAGTARKSGSPSPEPSAAQTPAETAPTLDDVKRQAGLFIKAQPEPVKAYRELRKAVDKLDPAPKWRPEDADIPPSLDTPEFRAAWEEWCQFRRQRKPAITEVAARKQLAKMAKHPVETCIESINESISNDYQGIFPAKARSGSRAGAYQPGSGDVYDPDRAASPRGDW